MTLTGYTNLLAFCYPDLIRVWCWLIFSTVHPTAPSTNMSDWQGQTFLLMPYKVKSSPSWNHHVGYPKQTVHFYLMILSNADIFPALTSHLTRQI